MNEDMLSEDLLETGNLEETFDDTEAAAGTPRMPVSGLYTVVKSTAPPRAAREELRLDVDGRYPQMTASGVAPLSLSSRIQWIASVTPAGANRWTGGIWFKEPASAPFPYANVDIKVSNTVFPHLRKATVIFSGGGVPKRVRSFKFASQYFHPVEFEFDRAENLAGDKAVTSMNTHDHPNRPGTLPAENLTIDEVFRRTGFDVRASGGAGAVPMAIAAPGVNPNWSDSEMHDAMQTFWSRFANAAQWSLWVFFASLHESGTGLGGIMFDDIGPNHRQGTAIFEDAFIANAPAGDPAPAAWVRRMRFWTAVHEMGHSFNLAHSWQKALGPPSFPPPWLPGLANEPEARSFMNYPYNVAGGQSAFFSDFEFRFSDGELLFMRHAPAQFVQQGNADWFDHHGFQQAAVEADGGLKLVVRANRAKPVFDFLEPVTLELKLTNTSGQPRIVPEHALDAGHMTIILKKQGRPARRLVSYAQYCHQAANQALNSGESIYASLYASSGVNGWDLAEPGNYHVQVCLHLPGQDIVSAPMAMKVSPPRGYEEENLAQDFFSDDVGRILTFDGSRCLESGLNTLRETCERLPDHRVSVHARVALGESLGKNFKQLNLGEGRLPLRSAGSAGGTVRVAKAKADDARKELVSALLKRPDLAAETLGHVDYKYYVDAFAAWLEANGDRKEAENVQAALYKTLAARKVSAKVLDQIPRPAGTAASPKKTAKASA